MMPEKEEADLIDKLADGKLIPDTSYHIGLIFGAAQFLAIENKRLRAELEQCQSHRLNELRNSIGKKKANES